MKRHVWSVILTGSGEAGRGIDLWGATDEGRMRILHVIRDLDLAGGGPPVVALKLATAQVQLGHEVSILSYGVRGAGAEAALQQTLATMPAEGRHVKRITLPPLNGKEALLCLEGRKRLPGLMAGFDAVHIHGVWERLLAVAANVARKTGKPYLVAPHGMLDPWSLSQSSAKKKVALALGVRSMLNHATALHVLNRDERDLMAPLKLKAPMTVIPNGVFLEELSKASVSSQALCSAYPQLRGKPYILFLSRLHYKKGLDFLAEAFMQLSSVCPDAWLVVTGPDGGAESGFREAIASAGLSDRVLLTGPLYGEMKAAVVAEATVFCLPSRQEGFSMAILESLAAGTPVVISESCHFPEVAEAGAGLVVPLVPAQIAGALERFLRDENFQKNASDAGINLVSERYTWKSIADLCCKAYRGEA